MFLMCLPHFFLSSVPQSSSLMIKQGLWTESGLTGSMRKPERGKKLLFQTLPPAYFLSPVESGFAEFQCVIYPLLIRKQCLIEYRIKVPHLCVASEYM